MQVRFCSQISSSQERFYLQRKFKKKHTHTFWNLELQIKDNILEFKIEYNSLFI